MFAKPVLGAVQWVNAAEDCFRRGQDAAAKCQEPAHEANRDDGGEILDKEQKY